MLHRVPPGILFLEAGRRRRGRWLDCVSTLARMRCRGGFCWLSEPLESAIRPIGRRPGIAFDGLTAQRPPEYPEFPLGGTPG